MKLLSPVETRTQREAQNTALSSRSAGLDEDIVAKRKELLTLDEEFLRAIEHNRLKRMEEESEWEQRNQVLRTETEELENRRKLALVPLENRERKTETDREALLQREKEVAKREEDAEFLQETLERRLDEASERLESASKRSRELDRREDGVKAQEALTTLRTEEFNALLIKTLADFDQQRTEIAERQLENAGKETVLSEKQARIDEQEKDLVSRETLLIDRYATLERAIEEHKRKNSIPKNYKN